jgi:hypothetical protein
MPPTPTARDRERAREIHLDPCECGGETCWSHKLIAQAFTDEREHCAQLLDALHDATPESQAQYRAALRDGAQAIRRGG